MRVREIFGIIVLTGILLCVRFWPLLSGKTLIFGDNYSLMVPGKVFTAQGLRKGELPFWNPYIFAGTPWVEDINQSVLYPTTLLFAKMHPATALNLSVLLHEVLAFIGMWQLARRWVKGTWWPVLAGWLWMFSTQVTGSINNLSTIQSIVWLPWLVWWGEQVTQRLRAKYIFALLVLLQFLAGYPQHVVFGILTAVVFSGFRFWEDFRPRDWRSNKRFQ